jgi:hypothetical protein
MEIKYRKLPDGDWKVLKGEHEIDIKRSLLWGTFHIEHVVINGLKWDTENTIDDDNEHFNFYEALGIAQISGKRLPTKEEFEALIALGSTWDDEFKGRWFGHDHELKLKSVQSVFFPAAGYQPRRVVGVLSNKKICGYYRSSSTDSRADASALVFNSGMILPADSSYRSNGLSVRCVSEL